MTEPERVTSGFLRQHDDEQQRDDERPDGELRDEHGDPACWAHLFEGDDVAAVAPPRAVVTADLAALAAAARSAVPWSTQSADLSINLLAFAAGDGVAPHVNSEVDVLLVGVAGEGAVSVDDATIPLQPGGLILIPAGRRRGIQAGSARFAYLSCHRARSGLITLQPTGSPEDHDAR